VPTLTEIVGHGHEAGGPITRAKTAGRGMALTPSPVEHEARRFGIPSIRKDATHAGIGKRLSGASGRRGGVVAYGLILPKPILDAVRSVASTCMLRTAALARRCPINRAIMAGTPRPA